MAKKDKLKMTALDNYGYEEPAPIEPVKRNKNVSPNSIANLRPRDKGRTPKKYMQLDIMGYEEYLNLMSKAKKMTRTKYILSLIRQDMEAHTKEYEALKTLASLDNSFLN